MCAEIIIIYDKDSPTQLIVADVSITTMRERWLYPCLEQSPPRVTTLKGALFFCVEPFGRILVYCRERCNCLPSCMMPRCSGSKYDFLLQSALHYHECWLTLRIPVSSQILCRLPSGQKWMGSSSRYPNILWLCWRLKLLMLNIRYRTYGPETLMVAFKLFFYTVSSCSVQCPKISL